MALLSLDDARSVSISTFGIEAITKSASLLQEEVRKASIAQSFDVFLSHCYKDVRIDDEVLLGVIKILENAGLKVYVDWLIDRTLSRENVTVETAALLRKRMKQSKCLLFLTSTNSSQSKWMPWELGYFDGFRSRVGILPLTGGHARDFKGQEYLGLYPLFDMTGASFWMHSSLNADKYVRFEEWLVGIDP